MSEQGWIEMVGDQLRKEIRTSERSKDAVWFDFIQARPFTAEEEEYLQEIVDAE